ncbi:hypothetical protein SAMN05444000_10885 [Shimia gijangensis]|uniref:Uncharacterized protein n=1 Tax=Shimia gijangensis TaxID=1470563 RepID=A0A1M6J2Y6_9RHOB|nr:hypothetical protein [Shimia gijangensis]SHJ40891.1 hypothetical protein SAMN05444000_10885 [Shimia gijangensis]
MPKLVRLYIRQVLTGFGLSAIFVGLLLWMNVANLWHLVNATSGGVVAVVMLFIFNGIVFAGVQFSIVIMRMAGDDRPGGGKKDDLPVGPPRLAPVEAKARSPQKNQ